MNPQGVHFVGSVPLRDANEVFTTICQTLPGRVLRIPDGETADRSQWVNWQTNTFKHVPRLQRCIDSGLQPEDSPSIHADQIPGMLGTLHTGYDRVALESYQEFRNLKASRIIPTHVKFQVSVPTPLAAISRAIDPHYQALVEPHWEEAFFRDLRNIQDNIPHSELSIQLDSMAEIFFLEKAYQKETTVPVAFGGLGPWFDESPDNVTSRLIRAVNAVDPDVELGFHFCYGDLGHKHFLEPSDTTLMAGVARTILTSLDRPVNYIHMPVPQSRTDAAYFEPLVTIASLLAGNRTTLFLGLIHANDLDGTKARIRTAQRVLDNKVTWGVATECGMGRTPVDQVPNILEIAKEVSKAIS